MTDTARQEVIPCYRITMTKNGKKTKEVMIREMKIRDYNSSMQAAAGRIAKDAPDWMAEWTINIELLKLLIVQVDGTAPNRQKLEDLDSYFSEKEFRILMKAMQKIRGTDKADPLDEPQIEVVTSGVA